MRKQLEELRVQMKKHNIDIYIVPTTDYHGSEYVNDYFKCREYISGFTGSAGTLAVTQDTAALWTDGRYFLQAEAQLSGSGIELMKEGTEGVPTLEQYIEALSCEKQDRKLRLGFDGRVVSAVQGSRFEAFAEVVWDIDLAGEIWKDRPEIKPSHIYELDISAAGETFRSKLARVRREMGDCDFLLVTKLEQIAWLYNLRGDDVEHTPVFFAFALIGRDTDAFYVMDDSFKRENTRPYMQIFDDLKSLRNCSLSLEKSGTSYALAGCLHSSVDITDETNPIELMKAVKNDTEIACTRNAHIRDGAAMVKFLYWIKNKAGRQYITEISAADYLEECRRQQGAYDLSFDTIAGYEEHGAIIHYQATKQSDVQIKPEGFLLVDSGGQYRDGTTDITRTIALGPVTCDRRYAYTAVLKSNIRLAAAKFRYETTGAELDVIARKPLKDRGFDFNHGTGHGVGHMLSVHEGPNTISRRGDKCCIVPGMITSDEPGVYFAGEYGIRLENEILCIEEGDGLCFETITLCPFDREAIEVNMLEDDELEFLNRYHSRVYDTLKEYLDEDEARWLLKQTEPLHRQ